MKKTLLIMLFTLFLGIIAACSGDASLSTTSSSTEETNTSEPEAEASPEADTVLVAEAFHSLLYLPLYVAHHQGFFEGNNIDISSIRSAGSGPTALASVLAGEAQFSVHGPEHVGFAKEKGGHAKALSAVANSAPVWILANEDVDFNSAEDLRGKRIVVGLAPGTSNTLLKKLLAANGLDYTKDVEITEVQNGSELGPVLAGKADIAVAYQPQVEQGIFEGLKVIYDFTEDYPDYAFSTFNTSIKLIEENPDLVKRFVKSMDEALTFVHQNPEVAKEVARAEFPELDSAVVDAAVQRMIDSNVYPQSSVINEEAFRNAIDTQKFVGNIKGDMIYEDIVDPNFTPE